MHKLFARALGLIAGLMLTACGGHDPAAQKDRSLFNFAGATVATPDVVDGLWQSEPIFGLGGASTARFYIQGTKLKASVRCDYVSGKTLYATVELTVARDSETRLRALEGTEDSVLEDNYGCRISFAPGDLLEVKVSGLDGSFSLPPSTGVDLTDRPMHKVGD